MKGNIKDKFSVGPLMYSPALNENLAQTIISGRLGKGYSIALCLEDTISDAPTADVEPVRRGKWLENEYRHYCSECGHMGLFNGFGFKLESNYCPHCGAKMEEYKSDIT